MQKRNFDNEASSWDDCSRRVAMARDIAETMVKHLSLTPRMDVLDFGCGTGLLTFQLCPLVRSVTGVDSSKGMLDVFQDKIAQQGVKNVTSKLVDLSASGRLLGRYHAIVSSMTLHHVPDTRALLEKFHQALLPGGQIAMADLDEEGGRFHGNNDGVFHYGFNREALKKIFEEAGFGDVVSTTAAAVNKPGADGVVRSFTIFLMTGRKK